ncbi:SDR family oxidoreductase [Saccharopolyspora dendranthemae]|uniref:7-alpha-hydroxysteroid dehydrogenase n=1 Tax=Saccharopolyspora dendranthemae TaxID=1181886 RepID=A0A561V920_9PSEU|nr:SDR family oxidoreductase [Saccharopolyspora dendranthemae]TWG08113.1 7-alpha-hydroxysteroid dehydrogenase [Saccharopolyspora dendranthemae]
MATLPMFRLEGRVAMVSGAGRGIGAATALALAEAGADVAVLSRTPDQIEAVAQQIRDLGRRAVAIPTDAGDAEAVSAAVTRAADELGRIDVVVSVTGGSMPRPFTHTHDEALRKSFENNVVHGVRLVREAVPHLAKSDAASVVMVSSSTGHLVGRGYLAYGAAKASLDHAVRMMAADLNPRIRVNAVAPGAILTEALEVVAADPQMKATLEEHTPLRRIGTPEDIAAAILYLSSPASSYVTGQVLAVDGGLVTPNMPLPIPDVDAE